MNEKMRMRTVVVRGTTYLSVEDVAEYIRACGEGEETDVRNRLKKAAEVIVTQTKVTQTKGT